MAERLGFGRESGVELGRPDGRCVRGGPTRCRADSWHSRTGGSESGRPFVCSYRANASNGLVRITPPKSQSTARIMTGEPTMGCRGPLQVSPRRRQRSSRPIPPWTSWVLLYIRNERIEMTSEARAAPRRGRRLEHRDRRSVAPESGPTERGGGVVHGGASGHARSPWWSTRRSATGSTSGKRPSSKRASRTTNSSRRRPARSGAATRSCCRSPRRRARRSCRTTPSRSSMPTTTGCSTRAA